MTLTASTSSLIVFTACSAFYLIFVPLQHAFGLEWSQVAVYNTIVDVVAMLAFAARAKDNFKAEDDWISRVRAVNARSASDIEMPKAPHHQKLSFWIDLMVILPFDSVVPLIGFLLPSLARALVGGSESMCACDVQPELFLLPFSSGCYTLLRLPKMLSIFRLPSYFSALEQTMFDAIIPRMVFLLFFLSLLLVQQSFLHLLLHKSYQCIFLLKQFEVQKLDKFLQKLQEYLNLELL